MTKIGLEIHCQLTNLQSKLFCSCKANYREFAPNENICPVCAGIPGSLPRLNQEDSVLVFSICIQCWYSVFSTGIRYGIQHWFSVLVFSIGIQYWYSALVSSFGIQCWYSVLVFSTGIQYW